MPLSGSSVPVDRVVAVTATLRDGREQVGSGYLVTGRLVLTAEHCTRDRVTGDPPARLRVIRAWDGAAADVAEVVPDRGLDVAVLRLADGTPWNSDLPFPVFARVDQSQSGQLRDCTGIGFPLFQRDPDHRARNTSEFHGIIYQTDERESGRLLMREPLIHPGPVRSPDSELSNDRGRDRPSPWGGLSGAMMFYRGCAIGVVTDHHPRQGDSALRAIGFSKIAASPEIRQRLGIPAPDHLPLVSEQVATRPPGAGQPLAETTDPFALEVHRPVQPDLLPPDLLPPDLPLLPAYVPRGHDIELRQVVVAAAEGRSGIAVLVGGSSTGKTRACWEALELLRNRSESWRLWHPIDPSRPEAALRELPAIGPRTVVWLNEAQFYLGAVSGLGERVAAGLRELLRAPTRAPVLVMATLWPQFWDTLTGRPGNDADTHAQARELLTGHDITVPAAFTPAQLQKLTEAEDPRLVQAAGSPDGQVIQFLAGAPGLLARYRNAPPAAAALIHAAMDARRLGMGIALPQTFLETAAPDYLVEADWNALDENWLEQALAYVGLPCKGVRGPLTPIRLRPGRSGTRPSRPGGISSSHRDNRADVAGVPVYQLADYLYQYGFRHRRTQIPPAGFWAAAADHASPPDQDRLGRAASARGLYRTAAQLFKNAAAAGNPDAIAALIEPPDWLDTDVQALRWIAAHTPIDSPFTVARLVNSLRELGAQDQAAALAARAAAEMPLGNPGDVVRLLDHLRELGAQDQVSEVLHRNPAARASLDTPGTVIWLLNGLRELGAQDQATALAARAAAEMPLGNPGAVVSLLDHLRELGAQDQVSEVLHRNPAAQVSLDNPFIVAKLVDSLRELDAQDQATTLINRATQISVDDPGNVISMLDHLRKLGAHDPASTLAARAATQMPLDDPYYYYTIRLLCQAGTKDQAAALAARIAIDNPLTVAHLLNSLRQEGAQDQATELATRAAAQTPLDKPNAVAKLLDSLRQEGAQDQATELATRAATQTPLDKPERRRQIAGQPAAGRSPRPGHRAGHPRRHPHRPRQARRRSRTVP